MAKQLSELLGVTMDRVKEMVDVDTVIGTPITVGDVTLIPISKVTCGFGGGGTDLPTKTEKELFGGGSGAGVSVTPIAMLCVRDGHTSVLPLQANPTTTDRLVSMIPDMVDRVSDLFTNKEPNA